eukprot:EG_transcript_8539
MLSAGRTPAGAAGTLQSCGLQALAGALSLGASKGASPLPEAILAPPVAAAPLAQSTWQLDAASCHGLPSMAKQPMALPSTIIREAQPVTQSPGPAAPSTSPHSKTNPFTARLTSRNRLTKPGSKKNTQHFVIDLKGSGLKYECGDSLGVFPTNDPLLVARTLDALRCLPSVVLAGQAEPLRDVLARKLNISRAPGSLAKWVLQQNAAHVATNSSLQALQAVAEDTSKLSKYLENFEVWDFLQKHNHVALDPSEAVAKLGALLPRLYSISSAQAKVGDEVHLSIAAVEYTTSGIQRYGVCTNYLCNLVPLSNKTIPIYVQSSDFKPPTDPNKPVIMIGPGTGVAPFRAFLQEREVTGAKGRNWLFFGEWNRATDFFYEDYWKELEAKGILRIDAAFSRDQGEKVYVQHLMLRNGAEFWRWLEDGAAVYVCGDAARMAKDVDKALHAIIEAHGKKTPKEAREYVKRLRQAHRYQRDIY